MFTGMGPSPQLSPKPSPKQGLVLGLGLRRLGAPGGALHWGRTPGRQFLGDRSLSA